MGRRRLPSPSLSAAYEAGPPKRIRVTLRTADGQRMGAQFSTRDARAAVAFLISAIDEAEADKIATRGDPTRKAKPPKRDGSRGITKAKGIRPPSRLRMIEQAALSLAGVAISEPQNMESLPADLRSALANLIDAAGVKAKGLAR